ncbi:kelch 26 [Octopus vulgaris]|uniref:Kelch 26 n=3 Tax=Octopus TaxID=6643 RepID=A0AA36AJZ7_OCTVU|nr:kelch-like protein 9 [Octopus bimaculoides]XP_029634902.1 kelch-like protein 9 [Octopus sinensis]CAI9716042.1 kelch 26 [Octopus vulgaris]|eukprot:XP_014777952.1 PREDICTED: kelch-like protein 9 [Octopus bimaculoides]
MALGKHGQVSDGADDTLDVRPNEPKEQCRRSEFDSLIPMIDMQSECHGSKLMKGYQKLRDDEHLFDYTIYVENESISVHKTLLAASSDYFHAMLTGSMKESREDSVTLRGLTAIGVQAIINFAYTGLLEITSDNIDDILLAASHLQVIDSVELCTEYLVKSINLDSCVDVLILADLYSLVNAQEKSRDFIRENFERIVTSEKYYQLTHTQLAFLLAGDNLRVTSEYQLVMFVLEWVKWDDQVRKQYLPQLLENIRLPLLRVDELDKLARLHIMRNNPGCNRLFREAQEYNRNIFKQPMYQTKRTQVRSEKVSLVLCHGESPKSYTFKTEKFTTLRNPLIPMYNPGVIVVDNFMYVCGGTCNNDHNFNASPRCFRFDPRFDTWTEFTSLLEARKDFVMVTVNKTLYAIGGKDKNNISSTMESYTVESNQWSWRAPINIAVYGHAGDVCKGKIYVCGGQTTTGCVNNFLRYDPSTNTWEDRSRMLRPRCNHILACVKEKFYAIGGNVEDSHGLASPIDLIESYNPNTDQWTTMEVTVSIRKAGAFVRDDKIYITGGLKEQRLLEIIQEYDPVKNTLKTSHTFPFVILGRACCLLTLNRCEPFR